MSGWVGVGAWTSPGDEPANTLRESLEHSLLFFTRSIDANRLRRKHRHQGPHWIYRYGCLITYMCGSRGGPPPPLENYKNIVFLSNTGRDPLKNPKLLPSQHSMLGYHRPASETPFKWCFAGGPLMAR